MKNENIALLIDKVKEAELVLVGIGEECAISSEDWLEMPEYQQYIAQNDEEDLVLSFFKRELLEKRNEQIEKKLELYSNLAALLKGKNYFVVSLCTDGLIRKCGLDEKRIVEPCGNYRYLQCSKKCTTDLYEPEKMLRVCPNCGETLTFNQISANGAQYVEEGYLEQWKLYTKWLQGTVNRKVCMIELGVGMQFPSVIRFPFEKVAYFNQKASFFRVHSRLYQVTEEIKEKSYSIQATWEEFLKELSNRI